MYVKSWASKQRNPKIYIYSAAWPHKCLHADWTSSLSARDLCSRTGYCSQWRKVNLRKLFSKVIKGYNTDFVINYRQRYILLTLPISAARYPPQPRLFHNTNSNKNSNNFPNHSHSQTWMNPLSQQPCPPPNTNTKKKIITHFYWKCGFWDRRWQNPVAACSRVFPSEEAPVLPGTPGTRCSGHPRSRRHGESLYRTCAHDPGVAC